MHFIVSWDISVSQPQWNTINDDLKAQLSGYSWVKPLTTLFVVKVNSVEGYNLILQNLQQITKKYPNTISLILSPLMNGGIYNGILSQELWNAINERSK
jgi:hypothetical protein